MIKPNYNNYIHLTQKGTDFLLQGKESYFGGHVINKNSIENPDGIFVIWEWKNKCLEVKNDRYGFYPVYYFVKNGEICVSTSILRLIEQGAPMELDESALSVFLRLGYFLGEDTAFKSIRALPPGANLVWQTGQLSLSSIIPEVKQQDIEYKEAIDTYIELFRSAITYRKPKNSFSVPLTGGRDSRHILLELLHQGHKPISCITAQNFAPSWSNDVRIAAVLSKATRTEHIVLQQGLSKVQAEVTKNQLTNFCSIHHGWAIPLVDYVENNANIIYDGIGGDVLSPKFNNFSKYFKYYNKNKLEELSEILLSKEDNSINLLLHPDIKSKFNKIKALERLYVELKRFQKYPNSVILFWLYNRTRRTIANYSFSMFSDKVTVYAPFLDHEVYDHLISLPIRHFEKGKFHTETIQQAFPKTRSIPFESKHPLQYGSNYYKRYSKDLLDYVISSQPSKLVNNSFLIPRLFLNSKKGRRQGVEWFGPRRIAYLIELEKIVAGSNNLIHKEEKNNKFLNQNLQRYNEKYSLEIDSLKNAPDPKQPTYVQFSLACIDDIDKSIPIGSKFIMVDPELMVSDVISGREQLHFLDFEESYLGTPTDDDAAIFEFNRLIQAGANYIVFVWSTFWWLDYYKEFNSFLLSVGRCVLINDVTIIYEILTKNR